MASWLEEPDPPGTFDAAYSCWATDGDRAVATGTSIPPTPSGRSTTTSSCSSSTATAAATSSPRSTSGNRPRDRPRRQLRPLGGGVRAAGRFARGGAGRGRPAAGGGRARPRGRHREADTAAGAAVRARARGRAARRDARRARWGHPGSALARRADEIPLPPTARSTAFRRRGVPLVRDGRGATRSRASCARADAHDPLQPGGRRFRAAAGGGSGRPTGRARSRSRPNRPSARGSGRRRCQAGSAPCRRRASRTRSVRPRTTARARRLVEHDRGAARAASGATCPRGSPSSSRRRSTGILSAPTCTG